MSTYKSKFQEQIYLVIFYDYDIMTEITDCCKNILFMPKVMRVETRRFQIYRGIEYIHY
jgi:hypothetical protein